MVALQVNQPTFTMGERLDTALIMANPGPALVVDMYVGIIFPDGWVWWFRDVNTLDGAASASLETDPSTFTPMFSSMTLIPGLNTVWEDFIEHTWSGFEGQGTYHLLVGWTLPGSLQDGRVDEGDVIALDWKALQVQAGASVASAK
jgi:hypothetical protein